MLQVTGLQHFFESHLSCVALISPLKFHTQHSMKNTSNIYDIITVLLNMGPIHLNNQRHHRWKDGRQQTQLAQPELRRIIHTGEQTVLVFIQFCFSRVVQISSKQLSAICIYSKNGKVK